MRILHIVHQYPPDHIGGTERYTIELAEQQVLAGHQVAVFAHTVSNILTDKKTNSIDVIEFRPVLKRRGAQSLFAATFGSLLLQKSFEQALEKFKPDLVHVEHLIGLPIKIIDRLVANGIPYITTLHDYWFVCANAQLLTNYDKTICSGPDRFINCGRCALVRSGLPTAQFLAPSVAPIMAWRNRVLEKALIFAERLIAPTHFVKSKYTEFYDLEDKIVVIPHGIKMPDEEIVGRQYSADELNISYVGGLSWQKGVHILIEAVNALPSANIQLGIYGDTDAFPEYVSEMNQTINHPSINLEGVIGRSQLWEVLSRSDVVVVPSLWYETASLIVQEAFAAKVPVVASSIGALQERVINEQDGLLVRPGDVKDLSKALNRLYEQPELRKKLQSGIKPVRTIEEHASAVEELYKNVIQ